MEKARQYSVVNGLLFLVGLVGAPIIAIDLANGLKSGKIYSRYFFVERAKNPFVFRLAVILEVSLLITAVWLFVEGVSGFSR